MQINPREEGEKKKNEPGSRNQVYPFFTSAPDHSHPAFIFMISQNISICRWLVQKEEEGKGGKKKKTQY